MSNYSFKSGTMEYCLYKGTGHVTQCYRVLLEQLHARRFLILPLWNCGPLTELQMCWIFRFNNNHSLFVYIPVENINMNHQNFTLLRKIDLLKDYTDICSFSYCQFFICYFKNGRNVHHNITVIHIVNGWYLCCTLCYINIYIV